MTGPEIDPMDDGRWEPTEIEEPSFISDRRDLDPKPLEAIAGQLVSTAPSRAEIRLGCLCYAVEMYKAGQLGTEQMDVRATAQSFADWVEQALE